MIDKEYRNFWYTIKFLAIAFLGLIVGGLITSLRYDSEIRNDQTKLKAKVERIEKDKAKFDNLTQQLIFEIKQVQADRKSLEELKIRLSKGEG